MESADAPKEPLATDSPQDDTTEDSQADSKADSEDNMSTSKRKKSTAREAAILIVIAVGLYYLMLTFVARPYLIPSESMEPTLHGCMGCTGDRIMVDKVTYRFGSPKPGDVIVFKGPPVWNIGYKSIRSTNTAVRWMQNALSFVGFVPPDENDLVKRVIAVGGQTVECRVATGLTVNGKPLNQPFLDPKTLGVDPSLYPCLGPEFGPVTVPQDRLWVMGDNRTHSADSRAHCTSLPADLQRGILCTGDPTSGTIPIDNVIGKARFIAWPPSRWGGVSSVDIQQGQ
jgi:signal peptidase I